MEWTLSLNMRLQPKHRFELEDALQEILEKTGRGEVIGGGTAQKPDGEIAYCNIDMALTDGRPDEIKWLGTLLNRMGIPKGSVLRSAKVKIDVGTLEGLACYLNGTDLPDSVYKTCDVNEVIRQMEQAMVGVGRLYSYWEGPTGTALYFYGRSFAEMKRRIAPFAASYPLCQKSRVEQIA